MVFGVEEMFLVGKAEHDESVELGPCSHIGK